MARTVASRARDASLCKPTDRFGEHNDEIRQWWFYAATFPSPAPHMFAEGMGNSVHRDFHTHLGYHTYKITAKNGKAHIIEGAMHLLHPANETMTSAFLSTLWHGHDITLELIFNLRHAIQMIQGADDFMEHGDFPIRRN